MAFLPGCRHSWILMHLPLDPLLSKLFASHCWDLPRAQAQALWVLLTNGSRLHTGLGLRWHFWGANRPTPGSLPSKAYSMAFM